MADLRREGDDLVLALTTAEKAESLHGDIRVPFASVVGVEVVDDIIHQVHGFKLAGSAWPGRFMIGTLTHSDQKKSFAVVHHQTPRGVRVRLNEAAYSELLVGCADPEAVAASLAPRT